MENNKFIVVIRDLRLNGRSEAFISDLLFSFPSIACGIDLSLVFPNYLIHQKAGLFMFQYYSVFFIHFFVILLYFIQTMPLYLIFTFI